MTRSRAVRVPHEFISTCGSAVSNVCFSTTVFEIPNTVVASTASLIPRTAALDPGRLWYVGSKTTVVVYLFE